MLSWWRRNTASLGAVWYQGTVPPHADEFAFLKARGLTLEETTRKGARWALRLHHPEQGRALLWCEERPAPDRTLLEHAGSLSAADLERARLAGVSVTLEVPGERGHILRDRKRALWFLGQAMGQDGVLAVDLNSFLFWSRQALNDELAHDADVDISALYCLHAISDDHGVINWLHSHGLDKAGAFDFDILQPSRHLLYRDDLMRALAFAILEGHVGPDSPAFRLAHPGGTIRMVPAERFDRKAPREQSLLRADPHHLKDRAVVCDPATGLLGRFSSQVSLSRFMRDWDGGDVMIYFSPEATELMAERARGTLGVLADLRREFAEFGFPVVVKLGYPTDSGRGDREHLWFTLHELDERTLEGTLENQPYNVARLRPGDRGVHEVSLLTDWLVLTPVGPITPRTLVGARRVRENPEQVRALLGPSDS